MRVAFFGDSLVLGVCDEEYQGWPGRLCRQAGARGIDLTCYNLGVRSDTSRGVRERWQREAALRLPPELDPRLVFSFGVNDSLPQAMDRPESYRVPPVETLTNARAILSQAKDTAPTLMVGPPPIGHPAADERICRLDSSLSQLCADLAIPYLSIFAALAASDDWNQGRQATDGVHPNGPGYAALARLVAAWPAWVAWVGQD